MIHFWHQTDIQNRYDELLSNVWFMYAYSPGSLVCTSSLNISGVRSQRFSRNSVVRTTLVGPDDNCQGQVEGTVQIYLVALVVILEMLTHVGSRQIPLPFLGYALCLVTR